MGKGCSGGAGLYAEIYCVSARRRVPPAAVPAAVGFEPRYGGGGARRTVNRRRLWLIRRERRGGGGGGGGDVFASPWIQAQPSRGTHPDRVPGTRAHTQYPGIFIRRVYLLTGVRKRVQIDFVSAAALLFAVYICPVLSSAFPPSPPGVCVYARVSLRRVRT